jgi:hypothetical protein
MFKQVRVWKEDVKSYLKVLSQHLLGHVRFQVIMAVSMKFKSSGMQHSVVLMQWTDVSEVRTASMITLMMGGSMQL